MNKDSKDNLALPNPNETMSSETADNDLDQEDSADKEETAWKRFEEEWNKISSFYGSEHLTKREKLEFISAFRDTESFNAMIWPVVLTSLTFVILTFTTIMCCCIRRAIYCCGRQFCDFSKNSAMNYNEAKNIEMKTITKPQQKKLNDEDLRKIAYYVRINAPHPNFKNQQTTITPVQAITPAQVHAELGQKAQDNTRRPIPNTPNPMQHTYANTNLGSTVSMSTIAEDSVYSAPE